MSRSLDLSLGNELGIKQETMTCDGATVVTNRLPQYTSDGRDMLLLDQAMRERGWRMETLEFTPGDFGSNDRWMCEYMLQEVTYGVRNYVSAVAETELLARGLAAYKALSGKDWEEKHV